MLYTDSIRKLLGLQDVIVTKVENLNNKTVLYAELERKTHNCICCGTATDTIHDYRIQKIKDISAFGHPVTIILRKRRYRCPHCGKRFAEKNTFLPKYHRMTNRLAAFVVNRLSGVCSYTDVARETKLSTTTVIRIFDKIHYPHPKLPKVLSIDEFKGNTDGEKYQCILTDPVNRTVLDILPKRYSSYLATYFNAYSREERNKVQFFISDMWKVYSDTSDVWFNNAMQIVDKYHWIRQVIWAFERIRKDEQKKLGDYLRKYFKHSKSLLIKRNESLTDEQKFKVGIMLSYSDNINQAYWCKERFLRIFDNSNPETARKALSEWIYEAESSSLIPFRKCAKTFQNWFTGIVNSLSHPYTNGFTEGCNNKIKVLKRNAYGFRNFNRFRNRILHIFSNQRQKTSS